MNLLKYRSKNYCFFLKNKKKVLLNFKFSSNIIRCLLHFFFIMVLLNTNTIFDLKKSYSNFIYFNNNLPELLSKKKLKTLYF